MRAASPPRPTACGRACCRSRGWWSAMSSPSSPPLRAVVAAPRRRRQALGQDPPHLPAGACRDERRRCASLPWRWSAGPGCAPSMLGAMPGGEAVPRREPATPAPPPIIATEFPPIEPRRPPPPMRRSRWLAAAGHAAAARCRPPAVAMLSITQPRAASAPCPARGPCRRSPSTLIAPEPAPAFYAPHSRRSTNGRCRGLPRSLVAARGRCSPAGASRAPPPAGRSRGSSTGCS